MELLERYAGYGLEVGGGRWSVIEPEVLVLMHVSCDFCPEGFRLLCEGEVICFLDSLYFRYDGVQYAAVIRRRCAFACPACLL